MSAIVEGIPTRSFTCLTCHKPMRMDPAHRKLDEETLKKPMGMDGESEGVNGKSVNLLKIICDIDVPSHAPICKECSDDLIRDLDDRLNSLEQENLSYNNLIATLQTMDAVETETVGQLTQQLRSMKDQEKDLEAELKHLIITERQLDNHCNSLKTDLEKDSEEENRLWRVFRDNHRQLLDRSKDTSRIDAELKYAEEQHRKLAQMNVLDLCFHIWVDNQDGTIGEINGLRLGRLPDKERAVEWVEINAAWGQAVLLLDVLMKRANVSQGNTKLIPMGSHSYIKIKRSSGENQSIPLHGSGSFKPFGNNNIDNGIMTYIQCFESLCAALKSRDSNFKLQYRINKACLVHGNTEYSAKMMLNSEERWTKAMKLLLTNLRTALCQVAALRPPT